MTYSRSLEIPHPSSKPYILLKTLWNLGYGGDTLMERLEGVPGFPDTKNDARCYYGCRWLLEAVS